MEKVYRKSSNGSISNFNVFFCFNIILTFATWFLRYFSAVLRLNICKAQVFFHVFLRKYLHFHIRKLFHRRVKSALIAHGESVFGRKGVRTQKAGTSLFANCVVYYDFMRQDTQRRRDT